MNSPNASSDGTGSGIGAVAWVGVLIAFGCGAWLTWRATESVWFPNRAETAENAESFESSEAPVTADDEPTSNSVRAPRERPDRAAEEAAERGLQLRCIEAARRAANDARVQTSDVLAQFKRLAPLTNPTRPKCKRILTRLIEGGFVEDHPERGYDLTDAGVQALADWRAEPR